MKKRSRWWGPGLALGLSAVPVACGNSGEAPETPAAVSWAESDLERVAAQSARWVDEALQQLEKHPGDPTKAAAALDAWLQRTAAQRRTFHGEVTTLHASLDAAGRARLAEWVDQRVSEMNLENRTKGLAAVIEAEPVVLDRLTSLLRSFEPSEG